MFRRYSFNKYKQVTLLVRVYGNKISNYELCLLSKDNDLEYATCETEEILNDMNVIEYADNKNVGWMMNNEWYDSLTVKELESLKKYLGV